MKENRFHLVESLLDNPFTIEIKSDDWDSGWGINKEFKKADVIVDKIKPISIVFYKNFIIDIWPNSGYGTRQLDYLNKHKKEISKKLMEISGLNEQQIQMQIEQNKAIKRMVCHDFFRSIDVNINRNSDNSRYSEYFQIYIEKIHLPVSAWSDDFYKDDLEHAWKNFYKGDWSEEHTHFGAENYFRRKAEDEKNGLDQSEFAQFMNENKIGIDAYHAKFFSLKDLDEGFEEFKKLKGKDSKFEESIVKIESRLAESFEKAIKNLQKEGFLKEAKSFDLNFTGKSINIRLNEAVSLQENDINAIYDIAQKESKKIIKAFNTELLNYGTFTFPKAFSSLRAGSIHYGCGMSDKYCLFAHMYDQGGIMKSSEMDQYISGMQLSGVLHSPEIEKIDRGIYKLSSLGRSYVEAVQDILAKHDFMEVVSDTVKSHWFATPKDYDWWQSIKNKVLTV